MITRTLPFYGQNAHEGSQKSPTFFQTSLLRHPQCTSYIYSIYGQNALKGSQALPTTSKPSYFDILLEPAQ